MAYPMVYEVWWLLVYPGREILSYCEYETVQVSTLLTDHTRHQKSRFFGNQAYGGRQISDFP